MFLSSLVSTSVSLGGGDIRKLLKLSGRLRSLLAHNGCVTSFNDMILEVRESLSVSDCLCLSLTVYLSHTHIHTHSPSLAAPLFLQSLTFSISFLIFVFACPFSPPLSLSAFTSSLVFFSFPPLNSKIMMINNFVLYSLLPLYLHLLLSLLFPFSSFSFSLSPSVNRCISWSFKV